jgi:hypothetical protein
MFDGAGGLERYFQEMSFGAASLAPSQTFGWYTLPTTNASFLEADRQSGATLYRSGLGARLAEECTSAAAGEVNFPEYSTIVLYFNGSIGGRVGTLIPGLTLGRSGVVKSYDVLFLNHRGLNSPAMVAHELGHLIGGEHADSEWDPLGSAQYGQDPTTTADPAMGGVAGYMAYTRDRAGWIPSARKFTYQGGSQQISLARLTQPGPDGYLMAEVPIDASGHFYTVELRVYIGFDASYKQPARSFLGQILPGEAVVIQRIEPGAEPAARTVTAVPGEAWNSEGAMWRRGERFVDQANNVSIRVDSLGLSQATVTIGPASP